MTKSKTTHTPAFNVGDLVTVVTAATLGEAAAGTITAVTKTGWFIVELDQPVTHPTCKDGKVSCRAASMAFRDNTDADTGDTPALPSTIAAQLESAATNGTKPAPKTKQTPRWPDECPECGSGELTADDESCCCESCGWEADEGDVEDALDEAEEHASKMAEALRKARVRYTKDRRPSGAATAHCGDLIAKELRDYEPLEVCRIADKALAQPAGFHEDRYALLNPGQQRMNSGNKIRAAFKKAMEEGDLTAALRIGNAVGLDSEEVTDLVAGAAESKAEAGTDA